MVADYRILTQQEIDALPTASVQRAIFVLSDGRLVVPIDTPQLGEPPRRAVVSLASKWTAMMHKYRGSIAYDDADRKLRCDAGTGQRNNQAYMNALHRAWRAKNRDHAREYQRLYMRRYRQRVK